MFTSYIIYFGFIFLVCKFEKEKKIFFKKKTILNFWTQKGYFQSKKEKKNENHHRILHIQINLGSKLGPNKQL